MPFVEPPSAIITTMAFSNASRVAMSRPRIPRRRSPTGAGAGGAFHFVQFLIRDLSRPVGSDRLEGAHDRQVLPPPAPGKNRPPVQGQPDGVVPENGHERARDALVASRQRAAPG